MKITTTAEKEKKQSKTKRNAKQLLQLKGMHAQINYMKKYTS